MNKSHLQKQKAEIWEATSGLDISFEDAIRIKHPLALKINNAKLKDGTIDGWEADPYG